MSLLPWLAACAAPAAPGGAAETAAPISVYQSDGSRQCQGPGESPQAMAARLLQGINVLNARKDALQDRMFPAVCGGATGSVNVFDIPASAWPQAQARGFQRWTASGAPGSSVN
ncbi:MAG: hypothetical protein Q4F13_13375 [Pseudomonadota bacterium]|nr:hypothetical protein [Pseudomonadota bacterium]